MTLDGLDSTSFLRSDVSDSFTSGTLSLGAGTTLDATAGTLALGSSVTKIGTGVVANLNADLLDGLHASDLALSGHGHPGLERPGFSIEVLDGTAGLMVSGTVATIVLLGLEGNCDRERIRAVDCDRPRRNALRELRRRGHWRPRGRGVW